MLKWLKRGESTEKTRVDENEMVQVQAEAVPDVNAALQSTATDAVTKSKNETKVVSQNENVNQCKSNLSSSSRVNVNNTSTTGKL